jgi:hypothetical protein
MIILSAFKLPGSFVTPSQLHCAEMMRGWTRWGRFFDGGIQKGSRDAARNDDSTNTGKGQGQKGTIKTSENAATMMPSPDRQSCNLRTSGPKVRLLYRWLFRKYGYLPKTF